MHLIRRFAEHREWNNWISRIYRQENSETFDVAFIDLDKSDFEFKLSCLTIDNQFNFAIWSNMSWRKSRENIHMNSSIWAMIIEKNSSLLSIRWCFIALICSKLSQMMMNLFSTFNNFKLVCWNRANFRKKLKIFLYSIVKSVWNKFSITWRLISLTCSWMSHMIDHRTHVRDLYVKQKIETMNIHRLFISWRSNLWSTTEIINRRSDNKRKARVSISLIIVVEFVSSEFMFSIFQFLKYLFSNNYSSEWCGLVWVFDLKTHTRPGWVSLVGSGLMWVLLWVFDGFSPNPR
jgi:hypothetical protein